MLSCRNLKAQCETRAVRRVERPLHDKQVPERRREAWYGAA